MQCRNCGATVRDNESICNVCGVVINTIPNVAASDISNPVTNEFISPSYMNGARQQMPVQPTNPALYDNNSGFGAQPSEKKYESKDGNDRVTATAINFATFALIIGAFIAICVFLLNVVF